jgi:hypothetical protein
MSLLNYVLLEVVKEENSKHKVDTWDIHLFNVTSTTRESSCRCTFLI